VSAARDRDIRIRLADAEPNILAASVTCINWDGVGVSRLKIDAESTLWIWSKSGV